MLMHIHPENPSHRQILKVVEILRSGGVIIYPTDTVYGLGCNIFDSRAVERIARIKGVRIEKANFSFICHDLSHLSVFTKQLDNSTFKLMKKYLPGPYTFILPASSKIPKIFKNKKKTVGIRIPDHTIPIEIVKELGNPLLTTSIHDVDKVIDYTTDPELIHENMGHLVDVVIDGGYGKNVPSTVIDCMSEVPEVVREGLGIFEDYA
ncbi:MAG: threonylcarbamoyl-AMP synthase [Bacteroidales bacterium]|nr:threonylcarbamoyl-AMP synthase [Bacteroidales bacterium]